MQGAWRGQREAGLVPVPRLMFADDDSSEEEKVDPQAAILQRAKKVSPVERQQIAAGLAHTVICTDDGKVGFT